MWIWQASDWPRWRVDPAVLQAPLAAARLAQGRALGLASHLQQADLGDVQLEGWTGEAVATAQIEGESLPVQSVRASAARRLGLDPTQPGHRDPRAEATLDVLQATLDLGRQPLSHQILHDWHAALFPTGRSGLHHIRVGAYRDHPEPMQIVTSRLGRPDIVYYQAPDSSDVPAQMAALVEWFNTPAADMDGLVRAALAHLWLEAIHPYEDGNGRVGRALAELALAQDLRCEQRLWSLSQQIWLDRKGYYQQLQTATGRADMEVTDWVLWFVGCAHRAADEAWAHMQAASRKTRLRATLSERYPALTVTQIKAIHRLYDAGPDGFEGGMSTVKYVHLCGVSRATAYRELADLRERGVLVQTGVGRGTRYRLAGPLLDP